MIVKLLTWLVMPLSQVLLLLLLAKLLRSGRPGLARATQRAAVILLVFWSMPIVSDSMQWALERRAGTQPATAEHSHVAFVLGGMLSPSVWPGQQPDLHEAIDRAWQAARLIKLGRIDQVRLLGGNQQPSPGIAAESVVVSQLMQEWGVPASAIVIETNSRNTRENAQAAMQLGAVGTPWLITSGLHMPRARAEFECAGVEVRPYPVELSQYNKSLPWALLPSVAALSQSTLMLKEWLGLAEVYWRCRDERHAHA